MILLHSSFISRTHHPSQDSQKCHTTDPKEEEQFIDSFACRNTSDIVTLNVSGTIMATRRDTLLIADDSMLAQQFDDTKCINERSKSILG